MVLRSLSLLCGLAMFGALTGCTSVVDDGKDTAEPDVDSEICDNDADDDGDGDTDCDDSDCAESADCDTTPTSETNCEDGEDEDEDGATDCDDTDCADATACEELPSTETLCADGLDDDGDGDIDCVDTDCVADPACVGPASETRCADGLDDDGDGAIDCDDSECAADAACVAPATELLCADGLDDDADGAIDCLDTDCVADAACVAPATETLCADGLDDDGDSAIDCLDTDCVGDAACLGPAVEMFCADGLDNDSDGTIDCADADCAADADCVVSPEPEALCADGLDDDLDGATDCADSDCAADTACAAPVCGGDGDLGSELGYAIATGSTTAGGDDFTGSCSDADFPAEDRSFTWTAPSDGTFTVSAAGSDYDTLVQVYTEGCASELACDDDGGGYPISEASFTALAGDQVVIVMDGFSSGGAYVLSLYGSAEADCDDGADDDGDTATDCDDSDCVEDAACNCADGSLGSDLGAGLVTGDTTGAGSEYESTCSDGSYSPEDESWSWTAPADGTYTVTTNGSSFDTVLSIWSSDCSAEATCDDDDGDSTQSLETFSAVAGERMVFVVDGYASTGAYTLAVYSSAELDCVDGLDEDGDSYADCDDSDCAADDRCFELVCDDGGDSDADGLFDCDDSDCADLLLCTNPCADDDLGSALGAAVATGDTTGAGDDYYSECAFAESDDVAWLWTAPSEGLYTFDTLGSTFDTVLSVEQGDCSDTLIECDDDTHGLLSELTVYVLEGEELVIQVDGYTAGAYTLNIWAGAEEACDDGADDEGDGNIDCLDSDCAVDAVCDTELADYDLGSTTGYAIATGSTSGGGDDLTPSCGVSYAEDIAYAWVAPYAGTWTFDLSASSMSDSVLGLYAADGSSLGCDDDSGTGYLSLETVSLDAGQLVIIGIDGYADETGDYSLAIY
ncbi:MAG: hypothetical protein Q8P18_16300 [Pseudomonadota bacterium]|nr:hypothetical protein [Pseudomonadota bacterium]